MCNHHPQLSEGFAFSVSPCIRLALISDLLTQPEVHVAFPGCISRSPGPWQYSCGLGGSWLHYPHPRVVDSPAAEPWTPDYYSNTQVLVTRLHPPAPGAVGTMACTLEFVPDSR